jgi:hypothetical protein
MKALILLMLVTLFVGCSESVVGPTEDDTDCQRQLDSLNNIITNQQFIMGQQSRMIRCLQNGGAVEDCYGGV